MKKYNPQEIEPKWQKYWEEQGVFMAQENKDKKKFFGLIEFPYPSGDGLHTGHLRSNTAMDIICRKRRMQGYSVLYPIGFDAFGLPTENYAIKKKIKPQEATAKNIATFTKQLKEAGFSFDWKRSFSTTDEDYYKWTQWIFIQMFKAGLAEKKKETINWCTSCKIGLANEEVVNGVCERCGGEVVKKEKEQWVLKITRYADRLINDLDKVDYLDRIKTQQINWIGKSVGAEVSFGVVILNEAERSEESHGTTGALALEGTRDDYHLKVFTTRPDTLFGATFMVVAPEHELIQKAKGKIQNYGEVEDYINEANKKSELERTDLNKEKTGVEIKGIKAINPVNGKEIPIFVADYVLTGYGTGAIMAVPAHDERDWEFAKKYDLEIVEVIKQKNNVVIIHGCPGEEEKAKNPKERTYDKHWIPWLKNQLEKDCLDVKVPLMPEPWRANYENWKKEFEKNEINENTVLIGHSCGCAFLVRWLGETNKKIKKLILVAPWKVVEGANAEPEFYNYEISPNIKNNVGEIVIFTSDDEEEDGKKSVKIFNDVLNGKVVELKGKGHFILGDMGTEEFPELVKVILEMSNAFTEIDSGEMVNSEFLNGLKPSEAIVKMTEWLEEKQIGKKQVQYKLHDWIFSRQRYWGEPIPMIYCEKCAEEDRRRKATTDAGQVKGKSNEKLNEGEILNPGWHTDENLPIVLPDIDDYLPTDEGDSPLAKVQDWVKTKCPVCGGEARRETDVMPNWAGSNWYFIRYADPKNDSQMVDAEKAKYWLPVDWYNGGMEHTTLHLLYSRFVWKFLYDVGAVPESCGVEPYAKRTAHGMILGEGGVKMSKSKGNVINPDEYVKKYGADTLRVYEMFMGPFDQPIAWDTKGVAGVYRFLEKVWNYLNIDFSGAFVDDNDRQQWIEGRIGKTPNNIKMLLHQTIKKVTEDIEEMKFNTAISALMIFINSIYKEVFYDKSPGGYIIEKLDLERFLVLLSPFAPHMAEELWQILGHDQSIIFEKWPEYDSALIKAEEFELVVQINGKVREKILVPAEIGEAEAKEMVMKNETVLKWLNGQEPKKIIYVKGKLVSVVM